MKPDTCIFVVDRDKTTANSVRSLAAAKQRECRVYQTLEEFFRDYDRQTSGCLVAAIQPPDTSGVELLQRLADQQIGLPTVLVTTVTKIRAAVQAMRRGAVTVLQKPLDEYALRNALDEALTRAAESRRVDAAHASLHRRLAGLSAQDRSVLRLMMAGEPSRRIAAELDVDVPTIDARLARMLQKTQTASLIDLARLALATELDTDQDSASTEQ